MRRLILAALLATSLAAAGCNVLGYLGYLVAPDRKVTRKAEYTGLRNRNVAVVIYADPERLYNFDTVPYELGMAVNYELVQRVDGAKVIDPAVVIRYQRENLHWDSMPLPELGAALGADDVLYISLTDFRTREPGSAHLARGRIDAQVSIWKVVPDPDSDGCVWRKESVRVVFPKDAPAGLSSPFEDQFLRTQTEQLFAQRLVQYFYDHKIDPDTQEQEE